MFPPHTDDLKLANEMGTFFVQKIKNIRSRLSDENCSPSPSAPVLSAPVSYAPVALVIGVGEALTEFNQLSEISVRKVILNSIVRNVVYLTQFHQSYLFILWMYFCQ